MCASANVRDKRNKKKPSLQQELKYPDQSLSGPKLNSVIKSKKPTERTYGRTVWSYYPEGNVEVPEICIQSINQQCPDEKEGCNRLHAKKKWHWQIKDKYDWYNFHETQSDRLERAFQIVEINAIIIPPLDFSRTGRQVQELAKLLGTCCWKADFEQMTITKFDHDDTYTIRRLSTPSMKKFKSKYSTDFRWYFQEDGSWMEVGKRWNTTTMKHMWMTSGDIEERYQKDQESFMTIKVSNSNWNLDFLQMEFIDENSNKILPVRRRPKDEDLIYPTIWSYFIEGEVEKAEMCMHTFGDKCSLGNGCGRLHSNTPWHWQFMHGGMWYNMPKLQREAVENSYLDVTKYTAELPLINPEKMGKLGASMSKLLGLSKWIAEFDNMTIARSDCLKKTLPIRRLSTPSSLVSRDKRATTFVWFFRDKNGSWVEFDNSEDVSEASWDSTFTSSDDIEKCYESGKEEVIDISTIDGDFELSFSSMKMCNSNTKEEIAVRRRPKYHVASHSYQNMMPLTFKITSEEEKEVRDLLSSSMDPQEIVNITKIQHSRMWQNFKDRQNEITATDKKRVVNTHTLFHWVTQEVVDDICNNNIEWRHQCPGIKSLCTLGVSFYRRAEFLHESCCSSRCARDHRLLVCKVLIGKLIGPKTKPSSRDLCCTEVDNIKSPTRYVKYDTKDYCPEYIIQI